MINQLHRVVWPQISVDGCHQQVFQSTHGTVVLCDASADGLSALLVVVMSRSTTSVEVTRGLALFQQSAQAMETNGMRAALESMHEAGATLCHITTVFKPPALPLPHAAPHHSTALHGLGTSAAPAQSRSL